VDDGRTELLKRIREEPPPSLPEEVPADLAAVVGKCLAKEPAARYATAAAVADDLEAWMEGRPVSVRPTRPANRWVLAAALVTLVALIALPPLALVGGAPVPPTRKKTVAERVAGGETVYLTDKTGRPFRNPADLPGQRVLTGTNDEGDFFFQAHGPGTARLLGEPLPPPVRLEAELSVPYADDGLTHGGGLFVGEKTWEGGPVVHHSAVRVVIAPAPLETPAFARPLKATVGLRWWQDGGRRGSSAFRQRFSDWGGAPGAAEKPRVVPVVVIIRAGEIRATIDGQDFAPLTAADVQRRLRDEVRDDPLMRNYPFAQPVLGDGIGITLDNTALIVRNLRLSRAEP
jgi:hypothetical protein